MARADVKLWFLDRLGMRICEAADLGEGFVDNLVNTIIGAGIDYVLEHAPDPKGAFLEMFPADIGTNYNEDDAHLDSVAGAKALTAIESIRVITKASGNMLPRTGSLTIAYQQLLERFVSSGVASLVPPASVEEAHARTYGNLSRASELRRMVLSRPIDGMPDIECTQFVQSMIPAIGGVSIKEAVLRQGTENPTDFTLDIRLLHESGKHILSAVSGKGLSFDQAAARAKRLGFSEGFRFDKKT